MSSTNLPCGGHQHLPAPPKIDWQQDALFLDFAGTLAAIEPTPDDARVMPTILAAALEHAQSALNGCLAVVSGRNLAALDAFVPMPALSLADMHGLERRAATGDIVRTRPSPALEAARIPRAA